MKQVILKSENDLQFAKLYNENGASCEYLYEPNSKKFVIADKFKEEGNRAGLKVLFTVVMYNENGASRMEGKDATTLKRWITGAGKTSTRAKKATTPADKVEALKKEWDALKERQKEITEMVGKAGKDLDWDGYLARLEAGARSQAVAKALEEMTEEEILAELARRKAARAE